MIGRVAHQVEVSFGKFRRTPAGSFCRSSGVGRMLVTTPNNTVKRAQPARARAGNRQRSSEFSYNLEEARSLQPTREDREAFRDPRRHGEMARRLHDGQLASSAPTLQGLPC